MGVTRVNANTMLNAAASPATGNFAINATSDLAVVEIAYDSASGMSVTGVTLGGIACVSAGPAAHNATSNAYSEFWVLPSPPIGASVALSITLVMGTGTDVYYNVTPYKGANQTTPVRPGTYGTATGSSTAPALTVSSNTNDLTVTVINSGGSTPTATNQTSDGINSNGGFGSGSDHATTAAGSVTHTWTLSGSSQWCIAGFSINGDQAAGGGWASSGTRRAPGQRGPFDQRGFLKSPFKQYSFTPSAGVLNTYVLTADQGAFTLTGDAANLLVGYDVAASKGTFTLTGDTANLLEGHVLSASKGTFAVAGVAANLLEERLVIAAAGTFVLNGVAAGLTKGRTLTAAPAAFVLTGVSANLLEAHLLGAAPAAFVLAGQPAALDRGLVVPALGGTFALAGVAAALSKGRTLTADSGTFALAGLDAILVAPVQAPVAGGGGGARKPFHGGLVHLQRLLKPLETKILKKIRKKRQEALSVHNETERLEAGVMPLAQLEQIEARAEMAEYEEELTMLLMLLDD